MQQRSLVNLRPARLLARLHACVTRVSCVRQMIIMGGPTPASSFRKYTDRFQVIYVKLKPGGWGA